VTQGEEGRRQRRKDKCQSKLWQDQALGTATGTQKYYLWPIIEPIQ